MGCCDARMRGNVATKAEELDLAHRDQKNCCAWTACRRERGGAAGCAGGHAACGGFCQAQQGCIDTGIGSHWPLGLVASPHPQPAGGRDMAAGRRRGRGVPLELNSEAGRETGEEEEEEPPPRP
eukprot:scaffold13281_cov119-Isochrysis_galbana.AAC.4